jgi:tetratricopeptide (TPR) repeat protein
MVEHALSHKREAIEEIISVYEQVLQLRPVGHERRDEAVSDLGDALFRFCAMHQSDDARAHRSLQLLREAVELRPLNHPLRDRSLHNLARLLLFVHYDQHAGGLTALTECIHLYREVLQLRTDGHPERAHSLANLAVALRNSFLHSGDPTFLEECIQMNRQVVQVFKPGHALRAPALDNLASALRELASCQGEMSALAESHSLHREALALQPPGHPLRFRTLDHLANSLRVKFELEALPAALSEAIELRREACKLLSADHPEWCRVVTNLAGNLITDFRFRRELSSSTEAIALLRRALLLGTTGNHQRHLSLHNLADALLAQFDECQDTACLQEAITLLREALSQCPPGHPLRVESLQTLGRILYKPACQSWPEALALLHEAVEMCPAGHCSRSSLLSDMSKCFLDPASPFFDILKGISLLSEGYSNDLSHVNQRLGQAVSDLRTVETAFMEAVRNANTSTTSYYGSRVLDLHAQVIGLLPRAANFGLDHKTRLQVITGSDEIARNAAARALLLRHTSQAIELLEEGRGVFWSQSLHVRTTGLDGVPDSDRENLLRLLRMLEHGARFSESSGQTVAQREEALERRRLLNHEAETLILRIRTYPGCTRFLLPAAFDSLMNGLPTGFVVVLNTSKLAHHALLLHKATGLAASVELESPPVGFDFASLRAQLPRDMGAQPEQHDEICARAMRLHSGRVKSFHGVLSQLWRSMIQPVIRTLGLAVSILPTLCQYLRLNVIDRRQLDVLVHGSGCVSQETSGFFPYMPLEIIEVLTLIASRTSWSHLTFPLYHLSPRLAVTGSLSRALKSPA